MKQKKYMTRQYLVHPAILWTKKLTWLDKAIFSEIYNRQLPGVGCILTNAHFAKMGFVGERTVQHSISKLKRLGLITTGHILLGDPIDGPRVFRRCLLVPAPFPDFKGMHQDMETLPVVSDPQEQIMRTRVYIFPKNS